MMDVLPWPKIHSLEVAEQCPAAIEALEAHLAVDPTEVEAVIRLGFNLWYVIIEADRLEIVVPAEAYAERFVELFQRYRAELSDNADFCWAYGLGISLLWYHFRGITEQVGTDLLARAKSLDSFWREDFSRGEYGYRFRGRGIFEAYYGAG